MPPVDMELGNPIPHGGSGNGYTYHGCRCGLCTEANARRASRRRHEREQMTKDPTDPRHGKLSFYTNFGCRCDRCREAASEKAAAARRKESA